MLLHLSCYLLFAQLIAAAPAQGQTKQTGPVAVEDDDGDSIPAAYKPQAVELPPDFGEIVPVDLSNLNQLFKNIPDAKGFLQEQEDKKNKLKSSDMESVSGDFWGANVNMDSVASPNKLVTSSAAVGAKTKVASTSPPKGDSASKKGSRAGSNTAALSKRAPDPARLQEVVTCLRQARSQGAPFQYYTSRSSKFETYSTPYNLRMKNNGVAEVVVVILPQSGSTGVIAAVRCAAVAKMPIQPRAGGHSYAAYSTAPEQGGGGMVIDLRNLGGIFYAAKRKTFLVEGGTRLGNFALGAIAQGLAMPHGDCPSVGLAGHSLHGGFGYASRMWGLSTDAIVGMRVVTAKGQEVWASETLNSELFWAMKGAGESFGIATQLEVQPQIAPTRVRRFLYNLDLDYGQPTAMAEAFFTTQKCVMDPKVANANFGLTIRISTNRFQVAGYHYGSTEEYNKLDACLSRNLQQKSDAFRPLSYSGALSMIGGSVSLSQPPDANNVKANFLAKSFLIPEKNGLTPKTLGNYFSYITSADKGIPNQFVITFRLMGGVGSRVFIGTGGRKKGDLVRDGAISNRDVLWIAQHDGNTATNPRDVSRFITGAHEALRKAGKGEQWGSFAPFIDPTLNNAQAHKAYFSDATSRKLEQYKYIWDPKNTFQNPQAVSPRK